MPIAKGYCQCGCGGKTSIAPWDRPEYGQVKGEPMRFIHTHHRRVPLGERFWTKVDKQSADECWNWLAARNHHGYGQIMIGAYGSTARCDCGHALVHHTDAHGCAFCDCTRPMRGAGPRPRGAHRVAWELTYGPIPSGLSVLHRCDNRLCVNPTHLFLGTQTDNMRDAQAKGRTRNTFTSAAQPHRLG